MGRRLRKAPLSVAQRVIIIAVVIVLVSLVLGYTVDERFFWVLAGPAFIFLKYGAVFRFWLGRGAGKGTDMRFLEGRSERARRREHQWPESSGDGPESGAAE